MGAGFGAFEGWGAIALGVAIGAVGAVSWAIGGIVGGAGIRAVAPGVVGVEGCVRAVRGGSLEKLVLSSCWMREKSIGASSGVGDGDGVAIEVSGVGAGGINIWGIGDGAIELSGVGDGAIELSGVADTYQDELGEFMRNSESFLNGWLKVLLCAGFCC